jgi:hypothetical protein
LFFEAFATFLVGDYVLSISKSTFLSTVNFVLSLSEYEEQKRRKGKVKGKAKLEEYEEQNKCSRRDGKGKRKGEGGKNERRDSFVCAFAKRKENLHAKGDTAFSDEGGGSGKHLSLLILTVGGRGGQMSE